MFGIGRYVRMSSRRLTQSNVPLVVMCPLRLSAICTHVVDDLAMFLRPLPFPLHSSTPHHPSTISYSSVSLLNYSTQLPSTVLHSPYSSL